MHILFYLLFASFTHDIYTISLSTNDGSNISLSQFRGKKLLVVNIASGSLGMDQIKALDSLQEKYKDQLEVIAIPSNSFGKEALSDAAIRQLLSATYPIHFMLGAKGDVVGANAIPVYKWLTTKVENGVADLPITENFTKFLVSGDGKIVGIFSGEVTPMSDAIQNAVSASY
jgi:glutathione peroxidase